MFTKHTKLHKREAKRLALESSNTPEARKARKDMNTHVYGRAKINTSGFYEKSGKHPLRCKATSFVNPKFI
jgi:hypothetical protein